MTENHNPKSFSTLQARAALYGVELHAMRNDFERWTFIATAGALTQELPSLEEVEQWLGRFAISTEAQSAA
jgi:hypothetical protein